MVKSSIKLLPYGSRFFILGNLLWYLMSKFIEELPIKKLSLDGIKYTINGEIFLNIYGYNFPNNFNLKKYTTLYSVIFKPYFFILVTVLTNKFIFKKSSSIYLKIQHC